MSHMEADLLLWELREALREPEMIPSKAKTDTGRDSSWAGFGGRVARSAHRAAAVFRSLVASPRPRPSPGGRLA